MESHEFDAFMVRFDALVTELVHLHQRQVAVSEQQALTNQRLELLILELVRQRRNGNPN